jgi:KDO2-lipid IV(A) lauroyltransferase
MDRALYNLMLGLCRLLGWLPPPVLRTMGRVIGEIVFRVDRRHRTITRKNLRFAYGDELTEAQVQALARGCYRHLGQVVLELPWLMFVPLVRLQRQVIIHGLANARRAAQGNKGIIFLGSHCGHWELSALMGGLVGGPGLVVVNPLDFRPLDRLLNDLRARWGNRHTPRQGAMRPVLRQLGSGLNVGIIPDQDAHWHECVMAPFFARNSRTNKGLALIWLATDSPVVPCFTFFRQGRWHVVFGEPLRPERFSDREKTVQAACARTNAAIEAAIRLHPEQWLWLHHRWRIYYESVTKRSHNRDMDVPANRGGLPTVAI